MANKDPAFLFYSSDFLTGVQDLTMEERGVYITLLCLQHQKGRLTQKMVDIVCHGINPADVLHKFGVDEKGLYYNIRLETEIDKRKQHSNKQRDRAIAGWEKRKSGNTMADAAALPLEDDNENGDELGKEGLGEKPNPEPPTKKTIADRKGAFRETLVPHLEKYGKDMLNEFFKYWTEPNRSGTAFRYESEKFWDLSKRLATWHKNQKTDKGEYGAPSQSTGPIKSGGVTFNLTQP